MREGGRRGRGGKKGGSVFRISVLGVHYIEINTAISFPFQDNA